jgi:hypothetical protein
MVTVPFTITIPCDAPWYSANRAANSALRGPDLAVQHHIRHGVGVALVDLRPGRIRLAAHAGTAVNRQNAHPILRDVLTPVRSRAYFPHCQ